MRASTIMERLEQMRDGIRARREAVTAHVSEPRSHRDCFNWQTGECSHELCRVSDAPASVDRDKAAGLIRLEPSNV